MHLHMFSIELIVFMILMVFMYRLRSLKPEWFAPLCGLTIFLPPSDEDIAEWKKEKEKQMKTQGRGSKGKENNKSGLKVNMRKLNMPFLETLSYFSEYELVILLSFIIFLTVGISKTLKIFLLEFRDTSLCFYLAFVLLVIVCSNVYKISSAAGLATSETKMFVLSALGVALIKVLLLLGFQELVSLDLKNGLFSLFQHLNLIFQSNQQQISYEIYLLAVVAVQIPLDFAFMPPFVRFASTYVKLKREIEGFDQLSGVQRANGKGHSSENKIYFRAFQLQIVLNLCVLLLFFKPLEVLQLDFNPKIAIYVVTVVYSLLCLFTMKFETESFLGKTYKYFQILIEKSDEKTLAFIQRKITAHIHAIVMVAFHILSKFLFPMILVALILIKRGEISPESGFPNNEVSPVQPDPKHFLRMNECQLKSGIIEVSHYGAALTEFSNENIFEGVKDLASRINKFGMISNTWLRSIFEFFLFDYFLCNYFCSLLYILFLGKSDIS